MRAAGVECVGARAGGAGRVTQKAPIARMKLKFARHLLSIALLPFTVAVLDLVYLRQDRILQIGICTDFDPHVFRSA